VLFFGLFCYFLTIFSVVPSPWKRLNSGIFWCFLLIFGLFFVAPPPWKIFWRRPCPDPLLLADGGFASRHLASGGSRIRPQNPIGLRRLEAPPQILAIASPSLTNSWLRAWH